MIAAKSSTPKRPRVHTGAVFVWVLALIGGFAAHAADCPNALPETARGAATVVTSGVLHVDRAAADVRLAGIEAAAGRGQAAADVQEKAAQRLKSMIEDHAVAVHALPLATDRDGRMPAHVVRDDGMWIQGELVRSGVVRVAVTPDTGDCAADLLVLEAEARAKERGVWADAHFAVRAADDLTQLDHDFGTYQLVEGRVTIPARRGDTVYLNFGDDYRTDFTVTIPRSSWPLFAAAGIKPLKLAGRQVRVRGWVTHYNGPALEVTHPAALEILDAAPHVARKRDK